VPAAEFDGAAGQGPHRAGVGQVRGDEIGLASGRADLRHGRVAAGPSQGQLTVTITRDDRLEWTYQLASWSPLAVGTHPGSAYLWSARELVVLPSDPAQDPVELTTDEDLLLVFRTEAGWVLVCETSVRLVTGRDEISRIELADTVRRAWWTRGDLQIEDDRAVTTALAVADGRLVLVTPGQFRD
jgi:hypothetical protein